QFFFFQAEDGIRDPLVTGVQTCALPIFSTRVHEDLLLHRPITITGDMEARSFGFCDLDVSSWPDVPDQQGLDVEEEWEGELGHTLDLLHFSEDGIPLL